MMKKFKETIRRSSSNKNPDYHHQHAAVIPVLPDNMRQKVDFQPPTTHRDELSLSSQDISEVEKPLFEKYWNELDTFGTGKLNLPYIATFLVSCHIPDHHIQQIIALFKHRQKWERRHVYALLRLVFHIKHGRDINADLIHLPAPPVPLTTEFSYVLATTNYQPRFRSFSDPSLFVNESSQKQITNEHHQRRSMEDIGSPKKTMAESQALPSSLLLTQAFVPPPSISSNNNPFCKSPTILENHNTGHINLKLNHAQIPPPPVPSRKTKPLSLKYSKADALISLKNIFDTPPNYHYRDQQAPMQQNFTSHSRKDKKDKHLGI